MPDTKKKKLKKGKKSKKGNKKASSTKKSSTLKNNAILNKGRIKSTNYLLKERERCLCPRLGDAHNKLNHVEKLKQDIAFCTIEKSGTSSHNNNDSSLSLCGFSLCHLPENLSINSNIVDLNLSKNNFFHVGQLLNILGSKLKHLRRLDLSQNCLSGKFKSPGTTSLSYSSAVKNTYQFTVLEKLVLDYNHLTEISPEFCRESPNIKYISAEYNDIQNISEGFRYWEQLQTCNLRNNKLEELSPRALMSWKNIQKLYLSKNNIRVFLASPTHTMQEINTEKNDSIAGNENEEWRNRIFGEHLKELDLRSNLLSEIPPMIGDCQKLKVLNLGDNRISSIEKGVLGKHRENLRDLYLYKNKLVEIPKDIYSLKKLERLSISNNPNITEFSQDLVAQQEGLLQEFHANNMTNLQVITTASHTTSFPTTSCANNIEAHNKKSNDTFKECTKLRKDQQQGKNLGKCKISEISLRGCPKLKAIPDAFGQCMHLKNLDLRDSPSIKLSQDLIHKFIDNDCLVRMGAAPHILGLNNDNTKPAGSNSKKKNKKGKKKKSKK
eukprot:CAMPEP_0178948752 /NCGR_PEP_ID=MMETSP0789-20121207/5653_1 /TAXON_ID=3005 /ORGANISM="Rhizosolenia setigera, Strain CCMP 1694" /LENGTH=551 /DNA_ID=CAMNT_0020629165 /DNA_START=164 /DNA_END=1816 /DNA_ORIENTATION=-